MELTKDFDDDEFGLALASWTFVDLTGLKPEFASLFGDVFLAAPDGTWWYLDRTAGTLRPEWANAQEMVEELQTDAGQDMYLLAPVALAAARGGLEPGPGQVYDWIEEPALGGRVELGNMQVTEFAVAMAVAGQIHADEHARWLVGEDIDQVDIGAGAEETAVARADSTESAGQSEPVGRVEAAGGSTGA